MLKSSLRNVRAWLFMVAKEDEFSVWENLTQEERIELEMFRVRNDQFNLGF